MWQLWNLSQATGQAPSKILHIRSFARRLTQMPDMWTALMFDTAVMAFGRYIEARQDERDDQGNRINTLERLLDLPDRRSPVERNRETLARLKQAARHMRGGEIVYLS